MKRILIVDDVPGWVRFHKGCIEHLPIPNVQIDCAYCAKEALAKLETSIDNPLLLWYNLSIAYYTIKIK